MTAAEAAATESVFNRTRSRRSLYIHPVVRSPYTYNNNVSWPRDNIYIYIYYIRDDDDDDEGEDITRVVVV